MHRNSFEHMGETCHRHGDYLLPDVTVPEAPRIGFWGRRRLDHLRKQKAPIYTGMLLSGSLRSHLEEDDRQVEKKCSSCFWRRWPEQRGSPKT